MTRNGSALIRLHRALRRGFRERVGDVDDAGIAMIMVIASITVLTALVTTSIAIAVSSKPGARAEQDWNAALAAAQAGVDDYLGRLNQDNTYWETVDCTNVALKGPKAGPNNCSPKWTSSTPVGWQKVSANNPEAGEFHYDVVTTNTERDGAVRLIVTGRSKVTKVGGQDDFTTRTLEVIVAQGGTTEFVYYTDYESADPDNRRAYPSGPSSNACGRNGASQAKYWWSGRSSAGCAEISFAAADRLEGEVHFNDSPGMSNNATFTKGFQTADPDCMNATPSNQWQNCTRSGKPNIPSGYVAKYAGPIYLPDNSDALGTADGCKYTGDVRVRFEANGQMRVWAKGSVGTTVGPAATCGTPTNAGLGSASGQLVQQPDEAVIYTKNKGGQHQCAPGEIGDGLPLGNDETMQGSAQATFYCGNGNIYVEGTVTNRLTIGAQNNVVVTGNILVGGTPAGSTASGRPMVGLVASNSVVVAHPYGRPCSQFWTSGANTGKCRTYVSSSSSYKRNLNSSGGTLTGTQDRYIYASIQTLQHSFFVQAWDEGTDLGVLRVRGSIAQRWRGAVGTSSGNGYDKDYRYDPRLKFKQPPYFPKPPNAYWSADVTGEIPPQY